VENALRHKGEGASTVVYLTAIGGGVFGNRMSWICDAIAAACERFREVNLDVRIVSYGHVPQCLHNLVKAIGANGGVKDVPQKQA
jgi:hypothetical protein